MISEFLGKCSKCKIRVDEALIRKHEEFTDIINKLMVEGHVNRIFHDLLQSAIELFHFNDCHFLQYLNICYNMLDNSDKAKKREVAQLLLKNYDQHRPKFDPAKGNFIHKSIYLSSASHSGATDKIAIYSKLSAILEITLARISYELEMLNEAKEHLDKAKRIMKIAFGNDITEATKKLIFVDDFINGHQPQLCEIDGAYCLYRI